MENLQQILINLQQFGIKYALEKIKFFLKILGWPCKFKKKVHVVGSKGKGTVSVLVSKILMDNNFRVGTFNSPHVISYFERFKLNLRYIDREKVEEKAIKIYKKANELMCPFLGLPSYFEFSTALALSLFEELADWIVLEAGLGGRLDATNVYFSDVVVLTDIELEHANILGDTLYKIAKEKLAVCGENGYLITGNWQKEEVKLAVKEEATLKNLKVYWVKKAKLKEIKKEGEKIYSIFEWQNKTYKVGLFGSWNAKNLALVLKMAEIFNLDVKEDTFEDVEFLGRFTRKNNFIFDSAHTIQAFRELFNTLKLYLKKGEKINLIFSLMRDKSVDEILSLIKNSNFIDEIYYVDFNFKNRVYKDFNYLKEKVKNLKVINLNQTKQLLKLNYGKEKKFLITGSIYLIGNLLKDYV